MDKLYDDLLILIFKNIDELNDIKNILLISKQFNKNMEKIKIDILLNHKNCDNIYGYLNKNIEVDHITNSIKYLLKYIFDLLNKYKMIMKKYINL